MTIALHIPKISTLRLMAASGGFTFEFDDVGVELLNGFGAGSFNGSAEITFWDDPQEGLDWYVGNITLQCHKWNALTKQYDVRHVLLEQDARTFQGQIYFALWSELTDGSRRDAVEAAVEARR